jgi:iron complex transport system ATP-binding protein
VVTLLEATALGFSVAGRPLVAGIDLALAGGEFVVVVGPNGAGKTTLLNLLTGELRPSAGEVRYDGRPVAAWPAARLAAKRAVMPQAHRLAFPFTVLEVVEIGLGGLGRALAPGARLALLEAALAAADVARLAGRDYQTLSGGEQQRVQFARVMAQLAVGASLAGTQLLFLDEPVASLDLCHQLAVMDAAAALARQGLAVMATLHDLNLATTYADRLLVLDQGRLAAAGPPAEVLEDRLLQRVFAVELALNRLPPPGLPFLLPQQHRYRAAPSFASGSKSRCRWTTK